MTDIDIFTSERTVKSLWQKYSIYPDRLELQSWFLFHTIVVPIQNIQSIELRPSIFGGSDVLTCAVKIDNADFCRHVLLTKKNGLFKRIAFTPDDPDKFVEICNSVLKGR